MGGILDALPTTTIINYKHGAENSVIENNPVFRIFNDSRAGTEVVIPDSAFFHGQGDVIGLGLELIVLFLHKFKDQFMRRSFDLEAFLNVVQEVFRAFI